MRPLPKDPEPAKVGETGLSLSWSGEPGQTFEFELAKDKSFQTIVVARKGLTEPTIDLPLPAPGRYYSRVRATDPDGFVAPYTTPQEITVEAKPLSIWFLLLPLLFVLF